MKSQKSEASHRCDVIIKRHNLEAIRENIQSDFDSLFIEINGLWSCILHSACSPALKRWTGCQCSQVQVSSQHIFCWLSASRQSCPISKQLKECFESHLKYFTKKKIRSTFDHVHISVKPLRLDLYWPIYPISPGAGEGELYPASVCLMASAASGARAGPWSPASRSQSRG